MKVTRFILKIAGAALALAAAVCCVIAFWDQIESAFDCAKGKIHKPHCCMRSKEYNDYADWDAE